MIPDGYTDLARGKIASVVTYLEMLDRPALADVSSSGVKLRREQGLHPDHYRALFRRVGTPWLWFSRLDMTDAKLAGLLQNPSIEFFVAEHGGNEIGIAEFDRSGHPNVEITSFGLFPESIGKGFGRAFMTQLLERAWCHTTSGPTDRVWLHTCNLDGPGALSFYMKCGFRPYKRAIEVADDPRIRGILPEDAAPQVPIIR
jgi:GNAT superfamily N-acetyltransferase